MEIFSVVGQSGLFDAPVGAPCADAVVIEYRSHASRMSMSPEFPPRGQIKSASTFVGDCCLSLEPGEDKFVGLMRLKVSCTVRKPFDG